MKLTNVLDACAKAGALSLLVAVPTLGCGLDSHGATTTDPASSGAPAARTSRLLDNAVVANDCGASDSTACAVSTIFTGQTFGDLQSAIDAAPDGDVLTVTGHCGGGTVDGRTGLTIQGPQPTFGCGFNGPGPGDLQAEVEGLSVRGSTNISVRFLNLVNSSGDGLSFDQSTTPIANCNCAAFNGNDGIRLSSTTAAVLSQNLSEANGEGIGIDRAQTVVVSNNTVTESSGNGITVQRSSNINVSFNVVTNNGGDGILFSLVRASLVTGNTISGNGDGLTNLIVCDRSRASGSNAPRSCVGF